MKFLSMLALMAPLAFALPTSVASSAAVEDAVLETRQSCYVKCGSTCYTSAQVSSARSAAYSYVKSGGVAGSSTYPHKYNNYEGFDFLVGGTYYEFPLKTGGVYTGGMLKRGWSGCRLGLICEQARLVLTALLSTAAARVRARLRTLVRAATTLWLARDGRCCRDGRSAEMVDAARLVAGLGLGRGGLEPWRRKSKDDLRWRDALSVVCSLQLN